MSLPYDLFCNKCRSNWRPPPSPAANNLCDVCMLTLAVWVKSNRQQADSQRIPVKETPPILWLAVNRKTGEPDYSYAAFCLREKPEHNDGAYALSSDWEWRPFKLVLAECQHTGQKLLFTDDHKEYYHVCSECGNSLKDLYVMDQFGRKLPKKG